MSSEKQWIQLRYGRLFDQKAGILFHYHPTSLNFVDNTSEHEPEVINTLPRLEGVSSRDEALQVIYKESEKWLDAGVAGPVARHEKLAAEVWSAWPRHKRPLSPLDTQ